MPCSHAVLPAMLQTVSENTNVKHVCLTTVRMSSLLHCMFSMILGVLIVYTLATGPWNLMYQLHRSTNNVCAAGGEQQCFETQAEFVLFYSVLLFYFAVMLEVGSLHKLAS